MLISIYVYIIYNILRINRYMHILYIETYIIYTLRAREEINGLGRSDRRGLLKLPDAWKMVQRR